MNSLFERYLGYYGDAIFVTESKIDDFRELYVDSGKLPEDVFETLVEIDPSQTSKYLQWMIKQYINAPQRDTVDKLTELIPLFNSNLQRLDSNKPEDVVFENENAVIVKPTEKAWSQKYGAGTKWCTASRGDNNLFNQYYFKDGVTLYYILPKDKTHQKYAISIYADGTKDFWEQDDTNTSSEEFNQYASELGIPLA